MNIKIKEIYSEVYGILNMLGKDYIEKLPTNLYNMIQKEKLSEYNPQYNSTIALEQQNVRRETLSMIALFHLNYWCDSDEEKHELNNLFKENERKHQAELMEKYKFDNLFKNSIVKEEMRVNESVVLVEYKENVLRKILNKIKRILHIR